MPEYDNIDLLISRLLKVDVAPYSTDVEAALSIAGDARVAKVSNGYVCFIEGVEWDGLTEPTEALAVCNAIFRRVGLPWLNYQ